MWLKSSLTQPIPATQLCYGRVCTTADYKPKQDVFNAAKTGAMVPDLHKELDYLIAQLKKVKKLLVRYSVTV